MSAAAERALMISTDEQPWAVVGWDTFAGHEYPVSRHATEAEAIEAGRRTLRELERAQPAASSGGPDGIQDRVYITGPEGVRYRLL